MSKTSTRKSSHATKSKNHTGHSEKLLVLAILVVGVIGLTVSYSSRSSTPEIQSASAADSIGSDGKVRSDHMILHLNQRGESENDTMEKSRF